MSTKMFVFLNISQIKIDKNGKLDYYMIPAIQKDCKTSLLSGNEKQKVIDDINSWSINAHISNDGKIINK